MKILFDELFENAVMTTTNESLNYPIENIVHPFMHKRFRSSSTSSVITATFTTDQTMSCFFYGFHTVTSLSVVYKNAASATLETLTISSPEDIGIEYFTELTTVRTVEITVNGASNFYIGKIGGGVCYAMPDPVATYTSGSRDNSSDSSSPYGQRLVNDIPKLRELPYAFRELTLTTKNEIEALYTAKNIFFDLYEEARTKEPPIYGFFVESFNFPYEPRRYSLSIIIREAK